MTVTMAAPPALVRDTDVLYHKDAITSLFGEAFWDEVIGRAVDSSIYTRHECEVMWDDNIAYLLARAANPEGPDAPLVCALLPDFMWHFFQLYNKECREFQVLISGTFLDHDPAEESALVNTPQDIQRTLDLFAAEQISYHPALWRDHLIFPQGARVIKTGIVPR